MRADLNDACQAFRTTLKRRQLGYQRVVNITHNHKQYEIMVAPDYVFGIRDKSQNDTRNKEFYFVKIDTGTMPVSRRGITQTSILRKVLSYADTFERGLAKKRFGIRGFQVIIVTTSQARIESIENAIAGLEWKPFSANTFLLSPKGYTQTMRPFIRVKRRSMKQI